MLFSKVNELLKAAEANDIPKLISFYSLPIGDSPSKKQTIHALNIAAEYNRLEAIKYLCELKTDNAPDKKTINHLLGYAVLEFALDQVKCLCELQTDNAPDKETINEILKEIASEGLDEADSYKEKFKFSENEKSLYEEFVLLVTEKNVNSALEKMAEIQSFLRPHKLSLMKQLTQFQCADIVEARKNLRIITRYHSIEWLKEERNMGQLKNSFLYNALIILKENKIKLTRKMMTDKSIDLNNMAVVIDKIDYFIQNYVTNKLVLAELKRFQDSYPPLLLTKDSIAVKKQKLSDLAKTHFHHQHYPQRFIADFLQCITGAFLIIMPVRYFAWGKHPFFTKEKTNREKEILSTMAEVKHAANR